MAKSSSYSAASAVISFVAIPWGAFVAAFLFYVGLTMIAIGVEQLPDFAMAGAYLLPVAAYVLLLVSRAVHAVAAVPVQIGQLAVLRLQ